MSEARDFLNALSENETARALIKAAKEPVNIEEAAELYANIAEKAGISVSKSAIGKLLKGKERIQKEASAKAEEIVKEALKEGDLAEVAGGNVCESTAESGEWCWVSDSCSVVINYYGGGENPCPMPGQDEYYYNGWQIVHPDDQDPLDLPDCEKDFEISCKGLDL